MDNMELARACAKTQCRKCKPAVKQACRENACWQNVYPKDNTTPAVFYGVLPSFHTREHLNELLAWRDKWFEGHPDLQKTDPPAWMTAAGKDDGAGKVPGVTIL